MRRLMSRAMHTDPHAGPTGNSTATSTPQAVRLVFDERLARLRKENRILREEPEIQK